MAAILKILTAFAAALPALLDWWRKRQAAKEQADVETRVADIRNAPADEWLHKFNSQAKPGGVADQAGTDQPHPDA